MALPTINGDDYNRGLESAVAVFTQYGDFIHAVIRSRVKNRAQADDLLQDFFLSLVSKPPPKGAAQNMKGYLFRAIANDTIDAARRTEKYQARIHRYAERLKYSTTEDNPENALMRAEDMNRILKVVRMRLEPSEADAVILRFRNNYKIKEVAAEMGVNNKTARRRISEGLRKVRHFLRIG